MHIAILANNSSGRGRAQRAVQVARESLVSDGHDVEVLAAPAESLSLHLHPESILVVAGGDGTLHHALPAAARAGCAVYHLPFGTENLFAREFGMTPDPLALRRAVQQHEIRAVDLGEANGRVFSLMCSVGPDAAVIHAIAAARTGPITHLTYVGPSLRQLGRPVSELLVHADGEVIAEGPGMVVVANSHHYGARFDPAPDAVVDDGFLDVVFFPVHRAHDMLGWLIKARLGRHTRDPRLVYRAATSVRIESLAPGAPCQVDGEAAGYVGPAATPALDIILRPRALRVLLPSG